MQDRDQPHKWKMTEEDLEAMGPEARAFFEECMEAWERASEEDRKLPREL